MNANLTFLAITYGLSIAFSLFIGLTGGSRSPFIGISILTMFIPALAVLMLRSTLHEKARIRWRRFPVKYLPVALLLMPVVMHLVMLPITAIIEGNLPWQDWLYPQTDGRFHPPSQRDWGTLTVGGLTTRIILNALTGVIIVSLLALFEEIGWRAWLLPRLIGRYGIRRAVGLTSLIWALWHVPFIVAGIHHLDGVSVGVTLVLMPVSITCTGLVIGWLWVRTESIWMVALAHGALNNWGQCAFKYMDFRQANPAFVLAAGSLAVGLVGSLLLGYGLPKSAARFSPPGKVGSQ